MSATDRTAADFEAAAVAHVHFRVRCETLGHGEEVYLVPDGGGMAKVGFSGYPLVTVDVLHAVASRSCCLEQKQKKKCFGKAKIPLFD